MAQISKTVIDSDIRTRIFADLIGGNASEFTYVKINDRQYGVLLTDQNGNQRYARVGVIVAEERNDQTAEELMAREMLDYAEKQQRKQEKEAKKAEKIARDAEKREKAKAKESEEAD